MTEDPARTKLLHMIENGEISPEDGLRLLKVFEAGYSGEHEVEQVPPDISEQATQTLEFNPESQSVGLNEARIKNLKRWWLLPFALGLILTIIGAYWMYLGYSTKGLSWGFWLSWVPFGIGVLMMVLSAISSYSKWIFIKVHEKKVNHPVNLTLAFPLPIKLAGWFLRTFAGNLKSKDKVPVETIMSMLDSDISKDSPFYVNVEDDDDHVEVFIG